LNAFQLPNNLDFFIRAAKASDFHYWLSNFAQPFPKPLNHASWQCGTIPNGQVLSCLIGFVQKLATLLLWDGPNNSEQLTPVAKIQHGLSGLLV
jgi:hypothetical protein